MIVRDRRLHALGGVLLITLVTITLLEAAVRIFAASDGWFGRGIATADPLAVKVRPNGVLGYRQRPGADFTYPSTGAIAHANAQGFRGPEVQTPKPSGVFRVVLLGESTTHGYGVADSQTIDAYMRADLAAEFPKRRIEVVNLAFDGYDAYQIWQRLLADGLPLAPDVVILNTGINDVRNSRFANLSGDPDPRTVLWITEIERLQQEDRQGGPAFWTRMKHWFYLARLPGQLRDVTKRRRQGWAVSPNVHPEAADGFEKNVLRIADTLARLRIPLILSTPPSALAMQGLTIPMVPRDYWVVDVATTQRYRDTLAARLRDVQQRLSAAGAPITYVTHDHMVPAMFLDDCHLTADGNHEMARDFDAALAADLSQH